MNLQEGHSQEHGEINQCGGRGMKEIVSEEVIALFKRATQWKESKLIILIPQVEDKFRAKFTWKEAF